MQTVQMQTQFKSFFLKNIKEHTVILLRTGIRIKIPKTLLLSFLDSYINHYNNYGIIFHQQSRNLHLTEKIHPV